LLLIWPTASCQQLAREGLRGVRGQHEQCADAQFTLELAGQADQPIVVLAAVPRDQKDPVVHDIGRLDRIQSVEEVVDDATGRGVGEVVVDRLVHAHPGCGADPALEMGLVNPRGQQLQRFTPATRESDENRQRGVEQRRIEHRKSAEIEKHRRTPRRRHRPFRPASHLRARVRTRSLEEAFQQSFEDGLPREVAHRRRAHGVGHPLRVVAQALRGGGGDHRHIGPTSPIGGAGA
jgi:hypothetical protein